jgi:hypothetical protein
MSLRTQLIWLVVIALPIACIAWTVTHEEVFREPREFCAQRCRDSKTLAGRKFFYLFTCEYCFSHYVTIVMLAITQYHLLFDDWRGYLIGGFALVFIANFYMSLYALTRTDLKKARLEAEEAEQTNKQAKNN